MGSPKNRCYFVLKVGKYFYIFSPLLGMRYVIAFFILDIAVTSRKGRVSRNVQNAPNSSADRVTSRKGRVSRNDRIQAVNNCMTGHVPQGACE